MVHLLEAITVPHRGKEEVYKKTESLLAVMRQLDPFYEHHIQRSCSYALDFGRREGFGEKELRQLYLATFFHDIGKVGIPAHITNKAGPLDQAEKKIMQTHPGLGENICLELGPFEEIAYLVGCHHERPNGTGYPRGLKGDEISELACILAIIEIYDALRSKRSYKQPFSLEQSLEVLYQNAEAGHVDKNIVVEFDRFVTG
ncbi:MAG: HD-GYP domain-containing protein [Candidatus Binatia bacterium]